MLFEQIHSEFKTPSATIFLSYLLLVFKIHNKYKRIITNINILSGKTIICILSKYREVRWDVYKYINVPRTLLKVIYKKCSWCNKLKEIIIIFVTWLDD
jgi:hypothetical protein